jgi:hypothetical protein
LKAAVVAAALVAVKTLLKSAAVFCVAADKSAESLRTEAVVAL